jgi:mono/diheme cytochrome c family protein
MRSRVPQLLVSIAIAAVAFGPVMLLPIPAAHAAGGDPPGKAVFLGQKCNQCHGIAALGIAATVKSESLRGPDLSEVGGRRTAKWIEGWLRRQETIEGKKHKKQYTGTDAQLADLVAFLGTLKKG